MPHPHDKPRKLPKQIMCRGTEEDAKAFDAQAEVCGLDRNTWMRLTLQWACGLRSSRPKP